jgi:Zn finger protein HypA/HybF involved in hydrogenase expression
MRVDPYNPTTPLYECFDCGHRVESEDHRAHCPECEGVVKNIAVSRE